MPLTFYDWIYGSAQIGAAVLSIIAAVIAVSMLRISHQEKLPLFLLHHFSTPSLQDASRTHSGREKIGIWWQRVTSSSVKYFDLEISLSKRHLNL